MNELLKFLAECPAEKANEALDRMETNWDLDNGIIKKAGDFISFYTRGFGKHEDMIYAIQQNKPVWYTLWQSSRRDGRHEFKRAR
jgi:hypothetical protein